MATNTTKVTLKLLVDKKTKKVMFAEARKEFVDFLCTLLSFPLGTVIRLLSKNQMVGCLGNLYQSIEDLSYTFIQPNQTKDSVLKPKVPQLCTNNNSNLLLTGSDTKTSVAKKVYVCPNVYQGHAHVADNSQAICPTCKSRMTSAFRFVAATAAAGENGGGNRKTEGGFVKGVVTYMVMDDLEVKPMSMISSLTLLSKFNVQQVDDLEERVVELGMDEGLNLLKASLRCNTVLTSVFLGA